MMLFHFRKTDIVNPKMSKREQPLIDFHFTIFTVNNWMVFGESALGKSYGIIQEACERAHLCIYPPLFIGEVFKGYECNRKFRPTNQNVTVGFWTRFVHILRERVSEREREIVKRFKNAPLKNCTYYYIYRWYLHRKRSNKRLIRFIFRLIMKLMYCWFKI